MPPGAPASFSMRGFSFSQLNTLYNGIKIGPPSMTSRVMDTGNLERIEFLKGPASLMSGEGAAGGAINFVTKRPHQGPVENEAYVSYGSFGTMRTAFGSGGSTAKEGLDYRFDLTRASSNGFIDDTRSENWHLSSGLDYRVSGTFKLFGAFEAKYDKAFAYWGTPLVSQAASGGNANKRDRLGQLCFELQRHQSRRRHDRQPHPEDELQRARQPQRSRTILAARRF